jgi:hypothetical protein
MTGVRVLTAAAMFLYQLWGRSSLLSEEYPGPLITDIKRPQREVYHLPLSSVENKDVWLSKATPSLCCKMALHMNKKLL